MSSLVPPSVPAKAVASSDRGKSKSSSKTKAARARSKNGAGVSTGKDVTHVVRVTVLGLAGITVDRSQCRYSSKDEDLPASPSKMRAVVALSRNSMIRGTTTLSKPLTRSPNDDVVVATTETEEVVVPSPVDSGEVLVETVETNEEEDTPPQESTTKDDAPAAGGDDEATLETKSTKGSVPPPPRRHLAVWASEDGSLGSTVTFEANLHRSDRGGPKSTTASSAFTPKSYDLTIGLTEGHNSDQTAVALPLGVATLTVSGDESSKGQTATVDLPVWTLSQARPLETSDGTGGYPVITLAPASETTTDGGIPLKKKRTGLQRLFSKKDKNGNIAFPSSAERDAFSSAYSMDSAGDAILRVSLEVREKGSRSDTSKETPAPVVKDQKSRRKVANRPGSPVARKRQETDSFDDEAYDSDEGTEFTDDTDFTDEYTEFTGSLVTAEDETITLDDSIVTNEDNRMVFFSWVNRPERTDDDDSRRPGRKRERRSSRFSILQEKEGRVSINVLGRQVQLPSCERSNSGDSGEDMTHVTADFLGDSYEIPLCRGIAKKDDDSTTTFTERNSASGTRTVNFLDGVLCQNDVSVKEDIRIVSTFSTLSDNPQPAQDGIDRHVPDEPSEIDDIMRIVRSKQPNRSPKALAVGQKAKRDKESGDKSKKSVTDVSPKGVEEFADADEPTIPRSRILQGISDILHCHYPSANNMGTRYEPFEPQIPPVIIKAEGDDVESVGELTATTHERNIEGASDARLLQRARQMLNESGMPTSNESGPHKTMSIPLCGVGICSPLEQRDTTSSPIRLGKQDTVSIAEAKDTDESPQKDVAGAPQMDTAETPQTKFVLKSAPDNDECSTFSPIEVEKVSSKEEGESFSRVRSPSATRREREKTVQDLYSESLPVYASMNGDGTDSVVGAFTESNSGGRQLFNPVTGQEVDQAWI